MWFLVKYFLPLFSIGCCVVGVGKNLAQIVKSALSYAEFLSLPLCQLKDSLAEIQTVTSIVSEQD